MNLLAQSAFLKALAWSLLHSLWQIGILWFLYLLITGNGKKFVSRQRYNLALILTLFGSLAFLITSVNQFYQFTEPVLIFQQSNSSEFSVENNVFDLRRFALWLEPCLAYLSFIYLFAIALLFIRFYRQYYFSKKLITRGVQKANPEIRIFLQQMAGRFAIKKKIRIGLSDLVYTPLTLGFWKPVILLPVAIVNQLNIKQTEAIILHELNHIKQNDYLINLFITCLDILLFFNPFSRLLTGILLKERENCCDDMVLQFRYTPKEYAKALLILEQNRLSSIPLISISATGNNKKLLLSRVQRILEGKNSGAVTGNKMYAFLIAAIIFGGIGFFNPGTLIIQPLPSLSGNYINKDLPVNAILYSTVEKSRIKKIIPPAHNPKTDFSFKSVPIHQEPTKYSQPNSDYLVTLASEKETIAGIDNDALQKKNNLSGYVIVTNAPREFSIQDENSSAPLLAEVSVEPSPYVPSSSFSYHYFEDTTLPKRYVPTVNELRAQENLVIALKALEDIDWKNVDNLIQGTTKKDLVWLVVELNKSLSESDWEKITSQEILRTGNNIPENTLKQKQRFLVQLQKFHKDQLTQKQMLEEKKRAILLERVLQNLELQKCEVRKQKEAIKERKIVVI